MFLFIVYKLLHLCDDYFYIIIDDSTGSNQIEKYQALVVPRRT